MWTVLGVGRVRGRGRASTTGAGGGWSRPLLIVSVGAARRRAHPRHRHLRRRARAAGSAPACSASSRARSRSSRCSLYAADLVSRRGGELARLAPGRCGRSLLVLAGVRRARDEGARPRLDDGARAHRRSRCSSPAACRTRHLAVVGRRSAIAAVTFLALAEPYRRARMLTFLAPVRRRRRTPATRSRSRSSRSAAAAAPASGSAPAGRSGTSSRTRTPTSSSPSSARSSASSAASLVIGAVRRASRCSASAPRCARPTASARCSPPGSRCGSSGRRSSTSARSSGLLPGHRHPAAVRVVRRLGAHHHDARGRHPRERRPPGSRHARPRDAARARDGDRVRRPHHRRRHRWPRLPRARARRRARRARPRPRARSASSAPRRGLEATAVPGGRLRDRPAARSRPRAQRVDPRALARNLAHRVRHRGRVRAARARWCGGCGPRVVVGVGGYASLPALVARARSGASRRSSTRPTPIPGLANRIAVRLGARAAVVLPGHAAPRGGGHRQPDPARDRRGARGRR